MTLRQRRLAMLAVSGIVLGVIGMQAAAVFRVFSFWPFIEYAMYRRPHQEGESISRYQLVAILADSTEATITPEDLGLNFWKFRNGPVAAVLDGDEERLGQFVAVYERRHGRVVSRVRLEDHPMVLTGDGVVPGAVTRVRSLSVSAGGSGGE